MQLLEVSGVVRHIYIYIYVIRRLTVKKIVSLGSLVISYDFRKTWYCGTGFVISCNSVINLNKTMTDG